MKERRVKMLIIRYLFFLLVLPLFNVFSQDSTLNYFQSGAIKAIGISAEGQSRYAAITSAEIIAQRNLVERIKGVSISSETQMQNAKITSDVIHTRVQGLIVGAISCGKKYYEKKGYNPLFIKSKSIKSHTDVVVSGKDADMIYTNNQKSNMLHRARVVFLLK